MATDVPFFNTTEITGSGGVDDVSEKIFDRFEFMQSSPAVAVPLLVILFFASVLGTFGNILIVISVATTKELRNVESIFLVNLAFSDLYVTMIADPMSIIGKYG